MKQFFYLVIIGSLFFTSCKREDAMRKFSDGTQYKIISDGRGQQAQNGNFIEVQIRKMYKDSVLFDSREMMPQFGAYDTAQFPPLFKAIFKTIHKGDSIYTRNVVDSIYKSAMPPYAKKGEFEVTTYKFVNVFTTKEQTDSAYNKWLPIAKEKANKKIMEQLKKDQQANAPQLATDDKILSDYITAHKLTAKKAPWGTYVVTTKDGVEPLTDSSIVLVNYTGKTLDGKVFDSNTDPALGHKQPIPVDMGQIGGVILGWTDGLKQMKKGSKGTFLIPSSLAYGQKGSGEKIKPNDNLIFDVEILDVLSPTQYQQMQMIQQQMQQMQQQQQQMQQKQQVPKK